MLHIVTNRSIWISIGLGYWSILTIVILYLLIDIWFIWQISIKTPNFWLIFSVINLAGIIAVYKSYKQIKR
ncbi:hypothetical protein F1B96_02795 [Lactobacillus crispatus]|uniref:Uncharacterized protein n=1 Tax=Lactobacillus crispatus TaxID=47770 RepID=A0AB73BSJ4_9LACO|nr:hypothetical protein F1B96_02795 [Lactobacillus crispatus]KAA8799566.1 hypothetical protein F1C02_00070 [Lactobacillus crispatus]KAA8803948.1 hypothetical protein F1C04_03690 [Lactobacillus crispatus]KAA8806418.1 hypothetical protein F1C05_01975 [Lactobacillus crispatus]